MYMKNWLEYYTLDQWNIQYRDKDGMDGLVLST